ncbi:MAG: riboflavin synthase [Candidatus Atribacteria bacterium]|nr:riboflavin synthase [Candidatus Atribacteria bacterium]
MFTGIIKETGKISKIKDSKDCKELTIGCKLLTMDMKIGDSIAVNGCCLTVTSFDKEHFSCDISYSTINSTTLANAKIGELLNLEDSLTAVDKLGGHFVTGHVDGVAKIVKIVKIGNAYKLDIIPPWRLFPFLAQKGSAALDDISLTIAQSKKDLVSFAIIPHTFENTNLKFKKAGDLLNIEVDMIARYIGQLLKNPEMENSKEKEDRLREMLIKYEFLK